MRLVEREEKRGNVNEMRVTRGSLCVCERETERERERERGGGIIHEMKGRAFHSVVQSKEIDTNIESSKN